MTGMFLRRAGEEPLPCHLGKLLDRLAQHRPGHLGGRRLDGRERSEPAVACEYQPEASTFFAVKRLDDCRILLVKGFGNVNESSKRTELAFAPDTLTTI